MKISVESFFTKMAGTRGLYLVWFPDVANKILENLDFIPFNLMSTDKEYDFPNVGRCLIATPGVTPCSSHETVRGFVNKVNLQKSALRD